MAPLADRSLRIDWDTSDDAVQYSIERDPDGAFGPATMASVATVGAATRSHTLTRQNLADVLHQTWRVRPCTSALAASCIDTPELAVTGNLAASIERITGLGAAKFKAIETMSHARSASGIDVLAVGIPEGNTTEGVVHLFTRQGDGAWVRQRLAKDSGAVGDRFGHSVSLSPDGQWLAVGVPGDDVPGTEVPPVDVRDAGSVHVYRLSGTTGLASLHSVLHAPNPGRFDEFGSAVAIDFKGVTGQLLVGAPFEDSKAQGVFTATTAQPEYGDADVSTEGEDFGAVYQFDWNQPVGAWIYRRYLKPQLTLAGASSDMHLRSRGYFGAAIVLNQGFVAIGAPGSSRGVPYGGAVQIHWRSNFSFNHEALPTVDQAGFAPSLRRFGAALSIARSGEAFGELLLIGDPDADVDGEPRAGRVYLMAYLVSGWEHLGSQVAPRPVAYAGFGTALALAGTMNEHLLIGTPGDGSAMAGLQRPDDVAADTSTTRAASGAVYRYQNLSGSWKLKARLKAPTPTTDARLGLSLAVDGSGDFTAVGSEVRDGSGGEVFLY